MESVAYILILALAIGVLFFSIAFREPPRFEKKEKQVIYSLINWEYMLIISVVTDDSSNGYFDLGINYYAVSPPLNLVMCDSFTRNEQKYSGMSDI